MSSPVKILILIMSWVLIVFICINNELDDNVISNEIKFNERINNTISSVKESSLFANFMSEKEEKEDNFDKKINPEIIVIPKNNKNIIDENDIIIENKDSVLEKNDISTLAKEEISTLDTKKILKEIKSEVIVEKKLITRDEIQEKINLILEKNKIIFKRMSTDPTNVSKKTISKIAILLKEYKDIRIEVAGHTDAKGKKLFNLNISQERSNSVKKELLRLGISENRVISKGYGESKPLVKNNAGYSVLNRRVEFNIIKE